MAKIEIGAYLFWEGKMCKVIGRAETPTLIIESEKLLTCPCCDKQYTVKDQFSVVEGSPLFQEKASPVPTI